MTAHNVSHQHHYHDSHQHDHEQHPQGRHIGLGPAHGNRFGLSKWGEGLTEDIKRRRPFYLKDWKDGITWKSLPATLFLYVACLATTVAFGGLMSALTGGSMGVMECLVSSASCGMAYAALSGQPMTIIGPTGLTLAFTTALYGFCTTAGVPFLGAYAWVGLWTSAILALLSLANLSDCIKYCSRFTDEIFNGLIATNFLYEATRLSLKNFKTQSADKTRAFVSLSIALGTFILGRSLLALRSSRFFVKRIRVFFSDFGPLIAIVAMTLVTFIPGMSAFGLERLQIPNSIAPAGNRPWLVALFAVPWSIRLACMVPAVLLTCLFFLDQNISVRVVNSPSHRMKKGPAYHLDLMMLALCTGVCSIFGLPWMCAATVQSLNHVSAMATFSDEEDKPAKIESVVENRVTGFSIHALIGMSLLLLPLVKQIPMAVVAGLFLFLGRNMMSGNEFFSRVRSLFEDPKLYKEDSPMKKAPAWQVHAFTGVQLMCLGLLWTLKLNKKTSLFFPSVIASLMIIRSRILPKFFPDTTLRLLDSEVGEEEPKESGEGSKSGEERQSEKVSYGHG